MADYPERRVLIAGGAVGEEVPLDRKAAHHLVHVLRMAEGERVVAFTPAGAEFVAVIARARKHRASLLLEAPVVRPRDATRREFRLGFSPPRAQRADWLIEKATELGVAVLQPIIFSRTQGEREAQSAQRLQRWTRIASEAAEQCRRGDLPRILGPVTWDAFLAGGGDDGARLLAHIGPDSLPLARALTDASPRAVTAVVGPEGGLTPAEADAGRAAGFTCVSLGPTLLRTETAAIACAALLALTALP